jgi:hypothetical protein
MQFITKNSAITETLVSCNNNEITEVSHFKCLGLVMDNTLAWNLHIDNVINKLTRVCFMIRSVKPYALFFFGNDLLVLISYYIFFWYYILGTIYQQQKPFYATKKSCSLNDRTWK